MRMKSLNIILVEERVSEGKSKREGKQKAEPRCEEPLQGPWRRTKKKKETRPKNKQKCRARRQGKSSKVKGWGGVVGGG